MEGTTTFYQLSAYTGQAQQIITCSIKAKAVRGMYSKLLKTRVLVELEDAECDGWDGISCSCRESSWLWSGRNDALSRPGSRGCSVGWCVQPAQGATQVLVQSQRVIHQQRC